jgi:HD-GYP domain-containing protein (c-di-GMP phosphodiesterase class II)
MTKLRVIRPRDPVADRRLVLLCGLMPAVLAAILALWRPAALSHVESSAYDSILRWAGADPPDSQIAIVDIDERSLATIGQWPWRRDLVGRMIDRLRDLGAATIAVDLIFAEPDRFGARPEAVGITGHDVSRPSGGPTLSDATFAGALGPGRVVLGYAFTFEQPGTPAMPASACVLHPLSVPIVQPPNEGNPSPLFRASGALCSLPVLARAAGASGFLNAASDGDGILRRAPLLIEFDSRVYPGLALAAVLAASSTRNLALRVANVNAAALTLDGNSVPLDGKGNLLLRYRGAKNRFRYVSAADVIEGRVRADAIRNKLVFVGATALGTGEAVATPFDTQFAGVEVHATVADNLLRQDFIHRSEHAAAIETQAALLAGLAVALLGARTGLLYGGGGAVVCLILLWGGSVWRLSSAGEFLSPLFPTLSVVAALPAMMVARLVVERRCADQARRESSVSRQLMIQSLLSITEARDAATGQHARRTQRYTRLLAEQLASHPRFREYLTPERIDLVATLAPLHDIGKVAIPDRLLNKPGELTRDEVLEMRNHPAYGLDVILQAEKQTGTCDDPILAVAKDIVYTHHERWDGTGYPRGLVDEQIPIPGRLVALVDVYDALVTKRVYRQPIPPQAALDLIVSGRGTLFDPAVVDAFLMVVPALADTAIELKRDINERLERV